MHSRQADELRRENTELKGELSAFDPAFWDEIEDLKLNYREAMDAKRRYEQMLSQSVSHSCDCKPTWLARLQIGWATRVLQLCVEHRTAHIDKWACIPSPHMHTYPSLNAVDSRQLAGAAARWHYCLCHCR